MFLSGRKVGETAEAQTPSGIIRLRIVNITFEGL
jgi:transcription elongation GreA/GreB family factor